jgi:hypothetical protein
MNRELKIGMAQHVYLKASVEDMYDDLHRLLKTKKPSSVLKILADEIAGSGIYDSKRPLVLDATTLSFVTPSRLTKVVYDAYARGDLTTIFETFLMPYAAWVEVATNTKVMKRFSDADTETLMIIGDWIRSRTPTVAVKAIHTFWGVNPST